MIIMLIVLTSVALKLFFFKKMNVVRDASPFTNVKKSYDVIRLRTTLRKSSHLPNTTSITKEFFFVFFSVLKSKKATIVVKKNIEILLLTGIKYLQVLLFMD